jgi:hypothetical protein
MSLGPGQSYATSKKKVKDMQYIYPTSLWNKQASSLLIKSNVHGMRPYLSHNVLLSQMHEKLFIQAKIVIGGGIWKG